MTGSLKKACGKKTKKECEQAYSSCKYTKKNSSNYCKNSNKKTQSNRKKASKQSPKTKRKYVRRNNIKRVKSGVNKRKPRLTQNQLELEIFDSNSYYTDSIPGKQELVLNFDNSLPTSTSYPTESNDLVIEFDNDVSKTQINQFKNRKTPFVIDDIESLTPNTDNILLNSNDNSDDTQFSVNNIEILEKRV